jgi:hypothetical protein
MPLGAGDDGMVLSPRATLGAYRLVERLAPVGPCEVWRAEQRGAERPVVVRFFPQRWYSDPEYLAHFGHEAPALRRLNHPNILTVLDYGEYDSRTYLVTPLLSGLSLDHLLGAPWPADEALLVLEPLASALDYAHARRVVHGDLEPANVFVTDAGGVLLDGLGLGWGQAEQLRDAARSPAGQELPRRRPSQVAPELLAGQPATPSSDLYALGAIAFELLTGRRPFEREIWPTELEARPSWAQSRPSTLPTELPGPIVSFLHRALAERPEDRVGTAGALVQELLAIVFPIVIPYRALPGEQPAARKPAPVAAPSAAAEPEVETASRPARAAFGRRRLGRRKLGGLAAAMLTVGLLYLLLVQPALVLLAGRGSHSAALLPSGEVLIAGGCSNLPPSGSLAATLWSLRTVGARQVEPGLLETSLVYGPNGWRGAGRLTQPRCEAQTVALPNGQVLAVGGNPPGTPPTVSAERFDPSSNGWYAAGKLLIPRAEYALTELANGQALVIGGANLASKSEPLASAERYTSASNGWSLAASLHEARRQPSATLLNSGEVLVVGGIGVQGISLAGAERYDPARNAWQPAGYLSQARARHTATVLANGQVLVVGGSAERSRLASAERFDPASGAWARAAPLQEARAGHTATLLPDGKVLVVAGSGPGGDLATVERYDPAANVWSPAGRLPRPRSGHTATLLPNGQVLVVGGRNDGPELPFLPTADLYDPAQNRWSSAPGLLP